MSLHNPDGFNRELPAGFDGLFSWDYLTPAFERATGRAIKPMDIDAHVEIGGHHLVFETKQDGVEIPEGQRQALMQLWAKGYHMLVFLWGKKDPMRCEIWWPSGARSRLGRKWSGKELTKERLSEICYRWAKWANEHPAPFQYQDPTDPPW